MRIQRLSPMYALLLLTIFSCSTPFEGGKDSSKQDETDTDTDTDSDSDTDTDSDTDSDTDTDTDADSDTDTDTDADTDCANDPAPASTLDNCVTAELHCGDHIVGTTKGGTSNFDGEAYNTWTCLLSSDGYAGPERVYNFTHPGNGQTAVITLDSPCSDLDLMTLFWEYWWTDGECPTAQNTQARTCDANDDRGGGTLNIYDDSSSHYLIIVDGYAGEEDQFELTVTCN